MHTDTMFLIQELASKEWPSYFTIQRSEVNWCQLKGYIEKVYSDLSDSPGILMG